MSQYRSEEFYKAMKFHMEQIAALGYTDLPSIPDQGIAEMRMIFMSDIDFKTYELEKQDYHIWFTCEVGGVEYRLAAPRY